MIRDLFAKKLLLFCGTGGVGKTTTAAAFAIRAAKEGKRVGLITIDPARRLATSLGLDSLSSEPQDLSKQIKKELKFDGHLSALMLDSHDTLFKFLLKVGGKSAHDHFRDSRLFEIIAGNFAGTHDYLAMEKLFELHESGNYDLIVLDTPPARHTLDFLDAPDTIARFFDDRIFSWFMTDARSNSLTEKLRAKGAKAALRILEKITGEGVIKEFVAIAPYIYQVKNSFVERQRVIQALLRSNDAGAIFVSSPTDLARGEVRPFLEDAKRQKIEILAFLINRSLRHLAPDAASQHSVGDTIAIENYQQLRFLVEEEEKNTTLVRELAGGNQLVRSLPELDHDVHELQGLYSLAQLL